MRNAGARVFLCVVIVLGCISIALTARYGYKQADQEVDRWIAAIISGSISLCAFLFDALAVKLWMRGARKASVFVAGVAGLAFLVTFTNSLGGIASRSDAVQAQRQNAVNSRDDVRREVKRLEKAIEDLGKFTPTDEAALAAATTATTTATNRRIAECGNNNEKRGLECKKREADEATATTSRATTAAAKATTDMARRYEAQIAAAKGRMPSGEVVGNANPLGVALENVLGFIGFSADKLTSWQQAFGALVFELCLVGCMVGYTMLGEVEPKPVATELEPVKPAIAPEAPNLPVQTRPVLALERPRPKLAAATRQPVGAVLDFLHDAVTITDGRVEMVDLFMAYQTWCKAHSLRIADVADFAAEIEDFGVRIDGDYVLDMQLKPMRVESAI